MLTNLKRPSVTNRKNKGYVTVACGTVPPAICLNIQFCCNQEGGDETA